MLNWGGVQDRTHAFDVLSVLNSKCWDVVVLQSCATGTRVVSGYVAGAVMSYCLEVLYTVCGGTVSEHITFGSRQISELHVI
jgi:hypothetical protein